MNELKPCPFCGGTDLTIESNTTGKTSYVLCGTVGCRTAGPDGIDGIDPIDAWNQRQPLFAVLEDYERGDLLDRLADMEHTTWLVAVDVLLRSGVRKTNGDLILPNGLIQNWRRLSGLAYEELVPDDRKVALEHAKLVLSVVIEWAMDNDKGAFMQEEGGDVPLDGDRWGDRMNG